METDTIYVNQSRSIELINFVRDFSNEMSVAGNILDAIGRLSHTAKKSLHWKEGSDVFFNISDIYNEYTRSPLFEPYIKREHIQFYIDTILFPMGILTLISDDDNPNEHYYMIVWENEQSRLEEI